MESGICMLGNIAATEIRHTVKNKTLQLCNTLQFSGGTLQNRGKSLTNTNETVIWIYTLSNRIESLLDRVNPLQNTGKTLFNKDGTVMDRAISLYFQKKIGKTDAK